MIPEFDFLGIPSLTKKNNDLHGFHDALNEDDIYKLQICTVML